ncbi:hypothetical protein BN1723_002548 [Verticillium longisporum]|uniref:C2H2-type domain-containing protein n=1 Tax=Verticillium longisporum TaxID=100787 RepID=A0A0G4LCD8_VERLO|nr:hypothetical protein BN1723_002548 [Verticillium longisporum]
MDKQHEELLRRPLYVYDLPPEVLTTLALKTDVDNEAQLLEEHRAQSQKRKNDTEESLVGSQACSLCGLSFASLLDQRSHLKSDWHYYNLKQKLRGSPAVSEVDFEKLIGDLDESLSGSDSEDTEDDDDSDNARKETTLTALLKKQAGSLSRSRRNPGKPPLIWFTSSVLPKNHFFGLYRAILTAEDLRLEPKMVDVVKAKQLEPLKQLEAFVRGHGAAKVVHEDGQHVVARRAARRRGAGAGPLEGAAGPGPKVKVGVRRGRRALAARHGKGRRQARVDVPPGREVRAHGGPQRRLLGVGDERFEGRRRLRVRREDGHVGVRVGGRRRRQGLQRAGGAAAGGAGAGAVFLWRGAVPRVQVVGAAERDDVLDLAELDGRHGVVGVRVPLWQAECDERRIVEVVFLEVVERSLLALRVLDVVLRVEGGVADAMDELWGRLGRGS